MAYEDAATDDAALTRAVAASARHLGCVISEHSRLKQVKQIGGQDSPLWQIQLADGELVTARILINAAGAWVNTVCKRIKPMPKKLPVHLVQGSHVILKRSCPAYIYTESLDGRVMFFRPWQGNLLAGTTETAYTGKPEGIKPTASEIADILATYNQYFPDSPCHKQDILGTFCGLRVFADSDSPAFAANRETIICCDQSTHPGYIALYGGKLTTYRKQAEQVMAWVNRTIKAPRQSNTASISLAAPTEVE